jgi:hypothetical protein
MEVMRGRTKPLPQSARQARRRKCGRWRWAVSGGGYFPYKVTQTAPHFAAWLGPHQVAVGVSASAEKLAFGIRAALKDRPDFAVWKLDLKDPFNELPRALLTQRFAEAPPPIRRLLPFVCTPLGPSAPLAMEATWADFTSVRRRHTYIRAARGWPAMLCMWFKPHLARMAPRCPAGETGQGVHTGTPVRAGPRAQEGHFHAHTQGSPAPPSKDRFYTHGLPNVEKKDSMGFGNASSL